MPVEIVKLWRNIIPKLNQRKSKGKVIKAHIDDVNHNGNYVVWIEENNSKFLLINTFLLNPSDAIKKGDSIYKNKREIVYRISRKGKVYFYEVGPVKFKKDS